MAKGQLITRRRWVPLPTLPGLPVLLYHGIGEEDKAPDRAAKYWLSPGLFRDHLSALRTAETRIRLLRELSPGQLESDGKPKAVLTFDDGCASDYEIVFPALQAASFRAEFFVTTKLLGRPGYLSWSQVIEMQRWGMSFQSHGHEHVDLSRLPEPKLYQQLAYAKHLLEDRLGMEVAALALPYGLSNHRVLTLAKTVGYKTVCCSRYWPARPGAEVVNRVAIHASTTPAQVRRILAKDPLWYSRQAIRSGLFYLPKRVALSYWPGYFGVQVPSEGQ